MTHEFIIDGDDEDRRRARQALIDAGFMVRRVNRDDSIRFEEDTR